MVLRPIESEQPRRPSEATPGPAWLAVAERQRRLADGYWLISQPDHANLSGDLAANFVSPEFPHIDALIARAIAAHDVGWSMFPFEISPAEPPKLNAAGKPMAFIEFEPQDFLRAWNASIDCAENVCPAGGILVSRHFCALGNFRLENSQLCADDRQRIGGFLERESARQQRLLGSSRISTAELERLLLVLQFCDLLSLYLCSGAHQEVEFPQRLADRTVRVRRHENYYRFDPSPFQPQAGRSRMLSLGVTARYFPTGAQPKLTTLAFLLC